MYGMVCTCVWNGHVHVWLLGYHLQENTDASLEDLDKPGVDEEPTPVQLQ